MRRHGEVRVNVRALRDTFDGDGEVIGVGHVLLPLSRAAYEIGRAGAKSGIALPRCQRVRSDLGLPSCGSSCCDRCAAPIRSSLLAPRASPSRMVPLSDGWQPSPIWLSTDWG